MYDYLKTSLGVIGVAIFIAFILIFVPWLTIWSINTLVTAGGVTTFHIPLNFWTWLAVVLIASLHFKSSSPSK